MHAPYTFDQDVQEISVLFSFSVKLRRLGGHCHDTREIANNVLQSGPKKHSTTMGKLDRRCR